MANNAPIGVFDSGIGGLTVANELIRLMPNENIIYFGDTARAPYGPRPVEELTQFTEQILNFMKSHGVKLAVAACNTMTFWTIDKLRSKYPFPIVGMNSGNRLAVKASKNKHIGVIATVGTVKSGKHCALINAIDPAAKVYAQPCPEFVPLVEREELEGPEVERAAEEYLLPLKKAGVDTLVLACTHYPFLNAAITRVLGAEVAVIDPAEQTAIDAYNLLKRTEMLADAKQQAIRRFFFSRDPARARRLAERIMKIPLPEFELVNLQQTVYLDCSSRPVLL